MTWWLEAGLLVGGYVLLFAAIVAFWNRKEFK